MARIVSGLTIYDHWKNAKTIEFGCAQANVAADYLRRNRSILISIANRSLAESVAFIDPSS